MMGEGVDWHPINPERNINPRKNLVARTMPIPETIETPPGRGRVAIEAGFARRTAIIAVVSWHTISENLANRNWRDRMGIGGVVLAVKAYEIIMKNTEGNRRVRRCVGGGLTSDRKAAGLHSVLKQLF